MLGTGELSSKPIIHAASFSASAKTKIEAAGATMEVVALKPKWTRAAHEANVAKLKAEEEAKAAAKAAAALAGKTPAGKAKDKK